MEHLFIVLDGLFRSAETFLMTGWDLTKVLQAIAAVVTILTGVYAIYKAIKFAERRLASRLRTFLQREEKRLVNGCRKVLTDNEKPWRLRPGIEPIYTNRELNRALIKLRFGKKAKAQEALEEALKLIDQRIDTAINWKGTHERQKALAHLLLGSIADSNHDLNKALEHFETALRIDGNDLDALKYAGMQLLKMENANDALTYFIKLGVKAKEKSNPLIEARSFVWQARTLFKLGTLTHLNRANALLRQVIFNFPRSMSLLEQAEVHEFHGLVRRGLTRSRVSIESYQKAREIYESLLYRQGRVGKDAREGLDRVKNTLSELRQIAPEGATGNSAKTANKSAQI
jgi:tetratricopeptide (TPR) repeat protein